MAARGRKIFFADADRAMPFTEFQKINEKFEYLHDKYPDLLVIGSRAHLEKESIAQRSLFRTILMKVSFGQSLDLTSYNYYGEWSEAL